MAGINKPTYDFMPLTGVKPEVNEALRQIADALNSIIRKPPVTVTGSRGGNAALADLLTQLAAAGIIIDSTSP